MHAIQFVSDEALPDGHDFLFVQVPDGALIFYRETALTEKNLEDSWAAYRALTRHPPVEPTMADVAPHTITPKELHRFLLCVA